MRILYLKRIQDFVKKHADAMKSIVTWKHVVENAHWKQSSDVLKDFPNASIIPKKRARFRACLNFVQ